MIFSSLYPKLTWRRILEGLAQRPSFTMQMIVEEQDWRRALIAMVLSGTGFWFGVGLWLLFGGQSWQTSLVVALVGLVLWPAVLGLLAAAYRVAARILDGNGGLRPLYAAMSFGAIPLSLFIVPSVLLSPLGDFGVRVVPVIGVALLLWTALLWAYAIRETQSLITEFAFVALAMPVTFLMLAIMATVITVALGTLIVGSF
jgi:hypothetical protein